MNLGLDGKVIMVAGASRGLGLGVARALAREGARISIGSRSRVDIEATGAMLAESTGAAVVGFELDARDSQSILHWAQSTRERFGTVYGLVVNAGGPPAGTFEKFGDDDWLSAFNLTLLSAIRMVRAVLPCLREGGGGSILTLTSSSIKEPIDNLILSNVMRAGVASLAKSLSRELARDHVRVNNLVPGRIDTDRVRALDDGLAARTGITADEVRKRQQHAIPMGRYGDPDEFGRAAAFLLSPAASYITGATLIVDGGKTQTVW